VTYKFFGEIIVKLSGNLKCSFSQPSLFDHFDICL
jgi:hypothetical protein